MRSPKAKFYAEIIFAEPQKGIGSVVSYSDNDLNQLKSYCKQQAKGIKCNVVIRENKEDFPKFNLVIIEDYNL